MGGAGVSGGENRAALSAPECLWFRDSASCGSQAPTTSCPSYNITRSLFGKMGFSVWGFVAHELAGICLRGSFLKQLHVLGPCRQDLRYRRKINEIPQVGNQG